MSPDEENLTVAAKTTEMLEAAAKTIAAAADKAKKNGLATMADQAKQTASVNRTTWMAAAAAIIAIFTIVHFVLDPVIKRQDDQQKDIHEVQLDVRELYRVSTTGHSSRLEAPPEAAK